MISGVQAVQDKINVLFLKKLEQDEDFSKGYYATGDPDTLIGAIHQFNLWKQAFDVTSKLFSTAGIADREAIYSLNGGNDLASDYTGSDGLIYSIIQDEFTTDPDTLLQSRWDLGIWAARAETTKTMLLTEAVSNDVEALDYAAQHDEIMAGVVDCMQALADMDPDLMKYSHYSIIINIGLLILHMPETLQEDDFTVLLEDIDAKLTGLRGLAYALDSVPEYQDQEINDFLSNLAGMNLTDYIDNLLTGKIFGLGEAASHLSVLFNMGEFAFDVLSGCIEQLEIARHGQQLAAGYMNTALEAVGRFITKIMSYLTLGVREVAKAALDIALSAIGISSSLLDMLMGLKMQVQEWDKTIKETISGISIANMAAPPSAKGCPIAAIGNLQSAKTIAEAAIKNAAMLPYMTLANTILKPLLENLSDLQSEIKSYTDMIGEALASAYNAISLPRWVDFVIIYQLQQMRTHVYKQITLYYQLRNELINLKRRAGSDSRGMELIQKAFSAYIRQLAEEAQKHDDNINNGISARSQMDNCIGSLESVIRLLVGRTATTDDKNRMLGAITNYGGFRQQEQTARKKIRASAQNLAQLWNELTEMRKADWAGKLIGEGLDSFRVYARIVRIIDGTDLNALIQEWQDELAKKLGPLPLEVPPPEQGSTITETGAAQ